MMLLARGLAGLQLGAVECLIFAYFSVSYEQYTDNLKILGTFEKKKAERARGYLFSSYNIGNMLGYVVGVGKSIYPY